MKTRITAFTLLLCLFASLPISVTAQPPKWDFLGRRTVNFGPDHDEIIVTALEGAFTAIMFKVKGAPINMHKVLITFGNGETQEIPVVHTFGPKSMSRIVDLPGNKRVITKVAFWYDTKNFAGKKALVELWGRH